MSDPGLDVLARRISYAQCWEDPAILQEALRVGPGDRALSIGSAGDNSLALAAAGADVTCLDLSPPQLALAELKLAAIQALPREAVHTLLGFNQPGRRVFFYHKVRDLLGEDARKYWDANEEPIRLGLAEQGRFERYLAAFRERVLPLIHRRGTVEALFRCEALEEQRAFFAERWDNVRWRGVFRLFFSRAVMARAGRSPEQFRYVEGAVSAAFLRRARHALTEIPVRDNFFVQWMLLGRYLDLDRSHPYLSAAGYDALRGASGRVRFALGDLASYLERCEPGQFTAFNYSNLFEYLSAEEHARILELTIRAARPGARIAYWNLLVPRWRPDALADRISRDTALGEALLARDRAFVYGGFQVETVRG